MIITQITAAKQRWAGKQKENTMLNTTITQTSQLVGQIQRTTFYFTSMNLLQHLEH